MDKKIVWENCTVCNHPKRDEIENTWLQKFPGRHNWSLRRMEQYFDTGRMSIERHCTRHVFLDFKTKEKITVDQYFHDVQDGISSIDPSRKDLLAKYKQWKIETEMKLST